MKIRADQRVGLLLGGVILLMFVAIGATIALPATDESLNVKANELAPADIEGQELFAAEGCYYCHTDYARETALESGGQIAGGPSPARSYEGWSPSMLGTERIGPDLARLSPISGDMIAEHGGYGSYAYLSDDELDALAAYLLDR
jgi:cbb3-type cytochrome oxidase cytochrome c subunit